MVLLTITLVHPFMSNIWHCLALAWVFILLLYTWLYALRSCFCFCAWSKGCLVVVTRIGVNLMDYLAVYLIPCFLSMLCFTEIYHGDGNSFMNNNCKA